MRINMEADLPAAVRAWVDGKPYTCDSIGRSGSAVLCYEDMVLKIEPKQARFDADIAMLRWLEGRLPVPRVLEALQEGDRQYLLMSRMPGKMACDPEFMKDPDGLVQLLADALQRLWAVDISDCPKERTLEDDLLEARERVEQGLIDMDDVEPETFGPGGFESPEALLAWLEENKPPLEPVLSHGDLCLPNVFLEGGRLSGFIDLGDCGISDRWRDIALCHRSLRHNFCGKYAACPVEDFDPDILFDKLGLAPDREKLRYYVLLDELF